MTLTLNYVVDTKRWVQHRRVDYFRQHQNRYDFRVLSAREFSWWWRLGRLRRQPIVFSSWRIVHRLLKERPTLFSEKDYQWFLGAVTSHSNIGGGLDPKNPIPNRTPEEAYSLAVNLLRRFKVVTVNSIFLHDLISGSVPDVFYCPNGVDSDFFCPENGQPNGKKTISIGWVGKARGPKNFPVVQEAIAQLEARGRFEGRVICVDKNFRRPLRGREEMRAFYRSIDYYLCASWNEGTPNPALEAAACGVPVVTTQVGNMPQLIDEGVNGFFVEPTVESVVHCFRNIQDMPESRYAAMSQAIRGSITPQWSWPRRICDFTIAFDALVQGAGEVK